MGQAVHKFIEGSKNVSFGQIQVFKQRQEKPYELAGGYVREVGTETGITTPCVPLTVPKLHLKYIIALVLKEVRLVIPIIKLSLNSTGIDINPPSLVKSFL